MGQGTSFENLEDMRVLNVFEMEALIKSKKEGKNSDVFLVDVRDKFEVEEYGSIPYSIHIPSQEIRHAFRMSESEFRGKYNSRMPRKFDKIVFYDQRNGRSSIAVEVVNAIGFKKATYFAGGYTEWIDKKKNAVDEDL
ncbi:putative heat shock protein 67B2 [Trypanosoma theileri]|uniref:Putative heat shock protein 67B2 n=1 Tax=Trypanosoma theileri TaxID=67003 RepID=A0A1X0NJI4_9TRYP|nr:putative heat shock protein 67B2 [Trypanosoma theileri]ORC84339.1 putative heat shock protein 67B2 [Trypanosoma theileri]